MKFRRRYIEKRLEELKGRDKARHRRDSFKRFWRNSAPPLFNHRGERRLRARRREIAKAVWKARKGFTHA